MLTVAVTVSDGAWSPPSRLRLALLLFGVRLYDAGEEKDKRDWSFPFKIDGLNLEFSSGEQGGVGRAVQHTTDGHFIIKFLSDRAGFVALSKPKNNVRSILNAPLLTFLH